ncbi:TPA_asm: RNA-directed RNA polymerase [ssRNA phage SRR5466338_2]|uniref:RNA-directed RNA polymerase n=1 Tax=ssRNA phage SRR5466338_2 TaxID=2786391 RepID=A0A8S5L4K8_9VIRU|nr:RNA-directed RNA polymerase [ssRNA phage SRR5466338_2]DAD52364.1 TPA_asm: RNA-directed RNA polymerase [ssRNA phage SRR5466338_2]
MRKYQQLEVTKQIASALCVGVGSPYAKQQAKLLSDGNWLELFKASVDPAAYDNAHDFGGDYAVSNFIRKLMLPGDVQRLTHEAIARFKAGEERGLRVNQTLRSSTPLPSGVEGILLAARRKIVEVIGESPNMQTFAEHCGWGPGATATLKSAWCTVDRKILEPRISVTRRALPYMLAYVENAYAWSKARFHLDVEGPVTWLPGEFQIVESERFGTVDKDGTSRRTIGIQPTANLFLQKGVGGMLRPMLKHCGIDLASQARNRRLAQQAFFQGLATLDLRGASNSVFVEFVRSVIPPDWFTLMDDLRCHSIEIYGEVQNLQLFGAMGNGFTFELETLLFYALCWAVVRHEAGDNTTPIAVYGDDIIVHSSHYERLTQVLNTVGFEVNEQKSFSKGSFYESCGGHYFKGVDVTPPYQKEIITDSPGGIRCANRIFRWALRLGGGTFLDNRGRSAYNLACSLTRELHVMKYGFPLPTQPWWLEGDGGLVSCEVFHYDRDGIIRLPLFKSLLKRRQTRNESIYAEKLRTARDDLSLLDFEEEGHEVQIEASFLRMDTVPYRTRSGRVEVWREPGSEALMSRGLVTPRGVVDYVLRKQRIYCNTRAVPEWIA